MTYGLHNFKNKKNYKNYVSGYEILYYQAAYQYIFWYNVDKDCHENIINLYHQAIIDYLNDISLFDPVI